MLARAVTLCGKICAPLYRIMIFLRLCRWNFSQKETVSQTFATEVWVSFAETAHLHISCLLSHPLAFGNLVRGKHTCVMLSLLESPRVDLLLGYRDNSLAVRLYEEKSVEVMVCWTVEIISERGHPLPNSVGACGKTRAILCSIISKCWKEFVLTQSTYVSLLNRWTGRSSTAKSAHALPLRYKRWNAFLFVVVGIYCSYGQMKDCAGIGHAFAINRI